MLSIHKPQPYSYTKNTAFATLSATFTTLYTPPKVFKGRGVEPIRWESSNPPAPSTHLIPSDRGQNIQQKQRDNTYHYPLSSDTVS